MQNADQITVAAQANISTAPVGTDLPTDLGALDPAFVEVGFTSRDGTTLNYSESRSEVLSSQRATAVRRFATDRALTIGYQMQQWNRENLALALGGGTWSEPSPGVYRYDPPDEDDALPEYSQVVDFFDGDRHGRLVIPKGGVNEDVSTTLVRTAESLLPVSFKTLAPDAVGVRPFYFLGDDAAFAPAGSGSGSGSGA